MDDYKKIVESLVDYSEEWFEFKGNWFEPHGIGEYISALSNAAALTSTGKYWNDKINLMD